MSGDDLVRLGAAALDTLMPMHLWIDAAGRIAGAGRAMRALAADRPLLGVDFFEAFRVVRPADLTDTVRLGGAEGLPLVIAFRTGRPVSLRGHLVAAGGGRSILNLALGLSDLADLGGADLTAQHFAPTDPTVDMLYLLEAKDLAFAETHRLIARLQGDKSRAEEAAMTDALTGLSNRRALDRVLDRAMANGTPFALCHVDLDYFKAVNDTLGHAAGDAVLKQVAWRLSGIVRGSDTVARIGGDEFILVFEGLVEVDRLRVIAERIVAELEEPVPHEGRICRISASIGITLSTSYDRPDADRMIADADAALYRSKLAGRACHSFHGAEAPG